MPRAAPCMVALLVLLTSGCAAATAEATTPATASADPRSGPSAPSAAQVAPPVSFPECQAEEFEFAGIGTLRGLGLHNATPVPPPDIDRTAKTGSRAT